MFYLFVHFNWNVFPGQIAQILISSARSGESSESSEVKIRLYTQQQIYSRSTLTTVGLTATCVSTAPGRHLKNTIGLPLDRSSGGQLVM